MLVKIRDFSISTAVDSNSGKILPTWLYSNMRHKKIHWKKWHLLKTDLPKIYRTLHIKNCFEAQRRQIIHFFKNHILRVNVVEMLFPPN